MTDKQKIQLADVILNYLQDLQENTKETPKMIGVLNKETGIKGFKTADIGTPIFDRGDKYFIILETLDGKDNLQVSYYKDTLKPNINFYE